MEILWNGTPQEIPEGMTVSEFLALRSLKPDTAVVELNDEICGTENTGRVLVTGDRLNVFRIVAGG